MYLVIFASVRRYGAISPHFRHSGDKQQKEPRRCKRIELHIPNMNMHNIHKSISAGNPRRAIKRAIFCFSLFSFEVLKSS